MKKESVEVTEEMIMLRGIEAIISDWFLKELCKGNVFKEDYDRALSDYYEAKYIAEQIYMAGGY